LGASIAVRVYDSAKVGSRTVNGAIIESETILRKAGIESAWVICAESDGAFPIACPQPLAANELAVRIVRRTKSTKGALGCTQCGAAIEDERGRGTYATLYADCLDTPHQVDGLLPSVFFGHLLAHEIGHLLLPGRDHTATGIMCAQMGDREWALAVKGQLAFDPAQAATFRAEAAARAQLAAQRKPKSDNLTARVK
jgi:hypothetical protein